jgi:hypothetical protein
MSIYWKWYTHALVAMDWIIVAIGIFGNVLILICLAKYNCLKSRVNKILFINLAISDLGVLVVRHSFHSAQLYVEGRWVFGKLACKLIPPVSRTFLTVSITTLVIISYYRYKSIVHVLKSQPSVKKTILLTIILWLIIFSVYAILDIPFRNLESTSERCTNKLLSKERYMASVILEKTFYTVCLMSIFYMFSKTKKALRESLRSEERRDIKRSPASQILKILKPTVIFVLFTLCPAWIIHTTAVVTRKLQPNRLTERYLMYHIVGILMVFNSAGNPFIYIITSRSLRNSIKKVVRPILCLIKNTR